MIKILMVFDSLGRGGSQAYAMSILKNIDRSRFSVDFVESHVMAGGYDNEILELGSKIWILPRFKVYNIISYYKAWRDFLSLNKYDIIHGHISNSAGIYLRIARKFGCKTIVHSHSAGYRGNIIEKFGKSLFAKLAKSSADLWFSCSALASIRLYGKDYAKYSKHYILPNAICVSDYKFDNLVRDSIRKQFNVSSDTKLYGHIGSFTPPKNHVFLIQIFAKICKFENNAKLMLCGDGPLRNEIEMLIKSLGIEDKVIFTGVVSMIYRYLMAMDIMLFPSIFEGLPISVIEAQVTGVPVLYSDVITKEVALTDLAQRMSLSENALAWAKRAMTIYNTDKMRAYVTIEKSAFNMEFSIKQLESLYCSLINK